MSKIDNKDYHAGYIQGHHDGHQAGATEYAKENAQLKRWKAEASELLNPILEYGQSKEANIPLGESITAVVLERCKQVMALQAKCERLEGERYETRLAMRMLLKAFKGEIKTERHKEWYAKAEAIFNKYHNVADVLRNEALSAEGEKEVVKPERNVSIGGWIKYCHDCGFPVDECNCIDEDELNQKEGKQ